MVFDRKKIATKKTRGLVQIEVRLGRRRKYISTEVRVRSDQWDAQRWVVRSFDSAELNDELREQVRSLEEWSRRSKPFTWEKLDRYLEGDDSFADDSFVDFVERTVRDRNDIGEGTRKTHRKLASVLHEFGRITFASDLTRKNIMAFDNWLHGRTVRKLDKEGVERFVRMRQQSIYSYHKLMRTYIHIGMNVGIVSDDPYSGLRFQRGESEPDRYISQEELRRLADAPMRSGSVARARDLFVFQCYTGLSYADLLLFDFSKAQEEGGDYVYSGKRRKTGESFFFVILPPAMDVLRRYGFHLPLTAAQTYNRNLKAAAKDAGIDKPVASHWARRTAGMMLINSGVRLETVARILGHASVRTTEQFYADIRKRTVVEEMKRAGL